MTQLILQSLTAAPAVLERLALLAGARQIHWYSTHALMGTDFDGNEPSLAAKMALAESAYREQIDLYWKHSDQQLGDFKLLVMDMDSTLITIECIDELADMQGIKSEVAAITEATMRGVLPFEESVKRRVALLKDLPVAALQRVVDERLHLSAGAQNLLSAAQQSGLSTLLVSGGFTFFTDQLHTALRFDFSFANQLEIVAGRLTGQLLGTIIDGAEKHRLVEQTCATLGISTDQAIVMGDGANDLPMLAVAGLSVAFRAKPVVRSQADVMLDFVGLDGLLPILQGAVDDTER